MAVSTEDFVKQIESMTVLAANIRNLAVVIDQIAKQKETA